MGDPFDGFVLTGGKSERMGRDKALIEVDGVAMATRVARALEAAGAATVVCVGGDGDALRALGLTAIDDEYEGMGPLGGVVSALATTTRPIAVLAPCDLLEPRAEAFRSLVRALDDDDAATAAVPVVDGLWRPLPSAVRTVGRGSLVRALGEGERAVHRAMARLVRVEVDAGTFPDADTPEDLTRGR